MAVGGWLAGLIGGSADGLGFFEPTSQKQGSALRPNKPIRRLPTAPIRLSRGFPGPRSLRLGTAPARWGVSIAIALVQAGLVLAGLVKLRR